MDTINNKQYESTWVAAYTIVFLIILAEIPYIQRLFGGYFIMLPFVLLFLLICYSRRPTVRLRNFGFLASVTMYFAIAFCYKVLGISSAGFGHEMHAIMYFAFFLTTDVVNNMNKRKKTFLLTVIMIAMTITIVSNTFLYYRLGSYQYFTIHRTMPDSQLGNLASTQYSTGITLMSGMLLIGILHDKNRQERNLWIVLFILCNWFNFAIAQRTINLLLMVGMYVLIIIYNKKNTLYINLLLILGFLVFLIVLLNFSQILMIVSRWISSERILLRLSQISYAMESGDIEEAGGSLTARYDLMLVSVRTWLRSPRTFLFGAGDHVFDNTIIGNHSQFIDVFAQYGIFGGTLFLYSVYKSLQLLVEKLQLPAKSPLYKQIIVVCLAFVCRGIFGGVIFEQVGSRMFVFLPILITSVKESTEIIRD